MSDYDHTDDIPCEFCGELYPLDLITDHQSIHVFYGHEAFDENPFIPVNERDNLIPDVTEVETVHIESVEEDEQIQLDLVNELIKAENEALSNLPNAEPIEEKIPAESPKVLNTLAQSMSEVHAKSAEASTKTEEYPYKNLHSQVIEEITTKKGEKLLVYGADIEPVELESEMNSYKMPNNPLLNSIPKEEDVEDINNLSDDDSEETLEEFWKRARDYLKRNRGKI